MGFSIKVAPGVRVRASSRGVRTSFGPRAARIHVGAGRTRVSSGFGPVTVSSTIGGHSGRRGSGPRSTSSVRVAQTAMVTAAQADKAARAMAIDEAIRAIRSIHHESFPPPVRPLAEPPEPVDAAAHRRARTDEALQGISIFKRKERRLARERAVELADAETRAEEHRRMLQQQDRQRSLDAFWDGVHRNEPGAVMSQLAAAFEDNEAPAAPLEVHETSASLTVLIPDESALPSHAVGTTPSGNVSLRKMPKGQRDELYGQLVSGCVLVTVKEAFAVAPAVEEIRIVAIRRNGLSAYGEQRVEALLAAVIDRSALYGVLWESVDARTILRDVAREMLVNEKGATRALQPLDLAGEQDVSGLLGVVDYEGDL